MGKRGAESKRFKNVYYAGGIFFSRERRKSGRMERNKAGKSRPEKREDKNGK